MQLELISETDKRLRQTCVKHEIDAATEGLVYDMIAKMQEHDGIGLAAPQLGVMEQLFVIGHKDVGFVVCINPTWAPTTEAKLESFQEGCLSFPDITLNIVRPARIKAKWKSIDGRQWEEELYGYQARCFMHEMDHLDGISMNEHVSPKIWREAVANAEAKKT